MPLLWIVKRQLSRQAVHQVYTVGFKLAGYPFYPPKAGQGLAGMALRSDKPHIGMCQHWFKPWVVFQLRSIEQVFVVRITGGENVDKKP